MVSRLRRAILPLAVAGLTATLSCGPKEEPAPLPSQQDRLESSFQQQRASANAPPPAPVTIPETTTYALAAGENPWAVTEAYYQQHVGKDADGHWRFWNATLTGSGYASPIELDIFPFHSAENAGRYAGRQRPLPQNFAPGTVLTMPNLENAAIAATYR